MGAATQHGSRKGERRVPSAGARVALEHSIYGNARTGDADSFLFLRRRPQRFTAIIRGTLRAPRGSWCGPFPMLLSFNVDQPSFVLQEKFSVKHLPAFMLA